MVRVVMFLVPLGVGFMAGSMVAARLGHPSTPGSIAIWWVVVIGVSSLAAHLTDRFTRRLLPLTVLLKMTMAFPDRPPSRFKVALRAGNVTALRRRIHEAIDHGHTDLAETSELVLSLSAALNSHDRRTRGHSERTRAYTDLLAEEMRLAEADRDKLRWAALLHDVGKIEVPAEILNKDGALSDEERDLVRQHPIHGMRLVAPILDWLGPWGRTIEHHHERYDGSGYPYGLKGTEICLGARIVSVADAYDVMTTGRSYQPRMGHSAARRELARNAGGQFDPVVVRALMNVAMGRLRWATGPIAGLADFPLLRPVEALGRDLVTLVTASSVTAAAALGGVIPLPTITGLDPAPGVVVASVDVEAASIEPSIPPSKTESPPATTAGATTTTQGVPPDDSTTIPPPPTTTATTSPSPGPEAWPDSASTQEEAAIGIPVLNNDEGAGLTLVSVSGPNHGSAAVAGSSASYQPEPDFAGTDAFTYQTCDSLGRCDSATVTIVVGPVNDPPTAGAVSISVDEGAAAGWAPLVADIDGPALTCTVGGAPTHGLATLEAGCAAGTYTPDPGYAGPDSFVYQVSDGSLVATATVTVTVNNVNQAPLANPDTAATADGVAVNIAVLANDSDPDGDGLTVVSVTAPSAGTATTDGATVTYTPSGPAYSGTIPFSYTVCDPGGLCSSAGVTVEVTASGSHPTAVDDAARTRRNNKVNINVAANDGDPDGDLVLDSVSVVSPPSVGNALAIGGGRIRYVAPRDFAGVVTFVYQICDAAGNCAIATVTVTVG